MATALRSEEGGPQGRMRGQPRELGHWKRASMYISASPSPSPYPLPGGEREKQLPLTQEWREE
jgi:hypothetical protein